MRMLCLGAVLAASAGLPAVAEIPAGVTSFTLDNGMEAVVIEDHLSLAVASGRCCEIGVPTTLSSKRLAVPWLASRTMPLASTT